ncbi:MAG TPA: permease [Burkholderiales bacterium]|nr:permease [Burkholderiales bacterium]
MNALLLLQSGAGNLAAYLAAHVLLCLVPAFFIAGALSALVPKESITRLLGRHAPKYLSYPAAAAAGSVLAVCSCTIVPLFAGIYKKGAGLGPAITFLFFAPAGNILALSYTGVAIGPDIAFARLFLSLAFGIGIGMIMALIFSRSDEAHDQGEDVAFAGRGKMRGAALLLLLALAGLLLAGTLKLDVLNRSWASLTLPISGTYAIQAWLDALVPSDPTRGKEGLSIQGVILIGLLGAIGLAAWLGLDRRTDPDNPWMQALLALVIVTLSVAATRWVPGPSGLTIELPGRLGAVALLLAAAAWLGLRKLDSYERQEWLWESWRFVKQIFPLLVVGVFVVGVLRELIQPEWIQALAGANTVIANMTGVLFGVFMYFPTLVEVPIANMFLDLGMHRGPLLAYLMADPELSLQSILMITAVIGRARTWTYVAWVAVFSTLAGLIYGSWVDGAGLAGIALMLAAFLAALSGVLWLVARSNHRHPIPLPPR